MLIDRPVHSADGGRSRVIAQVAADDARLASLDALWFDVAGEEPLSDRADAFLVALLPVAMAVGEPIEVRGPVSPRLLAGLHQTMAILSTWWPDDFRSVEIRAASLEEPTPVGRGAGCAFSGGVDSFFTVWRHLQRNESIPPHRLTHAVMINGYDRDLDAGENTIFPVLRAVYTPLLAAEGVRFVVLRTNVQEFRRAVMTETVRFRSHGSPLHAAAHALAPSFATFYVAAGRTYDDPRPNGTHPTTDPLASSEALRIVHDGGDSSRAQKIEALTRWPATRGALRVCFDTTYLDRPTAAIRNCGKCPKCVHTFMTLEVFDAGAGYTCFAGIDRSVFARTYSTSDTWIGYAREIEQLARARGREDIVRPLRQAMLRYRLFRFAYGIYRRFLRPLRPSRRA